MQISVCKKWKTIYIAEDKDKIQMINIEKIFANRGQKAVVPQTLPWI